MILHVWLAREFSERARAQELLRLVISLRKEQRQDSMAYSRFYEWEDEAQTVVRVATRASLDDVIDMLKHKPTWMEYPWSYTMHEEGHPLSVGIVLPSDLADLEVDEWTHFLLSHLGPQYQEWGWA